LLFPAVLFCLQKLLCCKATFLIGFAAQVFFLRFALPFSVDIQRAHRQHNVCMGVMPIRVVDGEVGAHTLVYTFRLDEAAQKQQPIIPPKFNGQGNDQLASKAAVLGFLGRLHRCPQGLSVFPRCRGLGRQ
jgi:hypothetical protein